MESSHDRGEGGGGSRGDDALFPELFMKNYPLVILTARKAGHEA